MRVPILVVTFCHSRLPNGSVVRRTGARRPASEDWNLYYQLLRSDKTTYFNSPYTGPLSLQDYREDDVS